MNPLFLIGAIAPAIVLVIYIFLRDKYEREPISKIVATFFLGMLSIPIALLLASGAYYLLDIINFGETSNGFISGLVDAFVCAAIPEEIAKLAILYILIWKNKNFNEPADGIVYSVCVSMGFACVENIIYVFDDSSVIIGRAIFAVPGHFLYAVLMGYYFSLVKFSQKNKLQNKILTLLAPILAHGIYDAILMISDNIPTWSYFLSILFYGFVFILWRLGLKRIKEHVEASPFSPKNIANEEDTL